MIYVKIWGGLGNQLFQYFFGQFLAYKKNQNVSYLNQSGNPSVPMKLDNYFYLNFEKIDCGNRKNCFSFYFFLYKINRKILMLFPFLSKKILVENYSHLTIKNSFSYKLYDGYWQNLNYLMELKIAKKFQIQFKNENLLNNNPHFIKIMNATNSVAVHVRRGDFLHSKLHFNLGMDYYKAAFLAIKSSIINPVFFIFSDDITWCKDNFIDFHSFEYINNQDLLESEIIDFYLMSKCSHFIIANSTYSWWAAFLGSSKNSLKIAPSKWFNTRDLAPLNLLNEEWLIIY